VDSAEGAEDVIAVDVEGFRGRGGAPFVDGGIFDGTDIADDGGVGGCGGEREGCGGGEEGEFHEG
jgi:hypothetical protein